MDDEKEVDDDDDDDDVSLCIPGCAGTHSVDHNNLKLRYPP